MKLCKQKLETIKEGGKKALDYVDYNRRDIILQAMAVFAGTLVGSHVASKAYDKGYKDCRERSEYSACRAYIKGYSDGYYDKENNLDYEPRLGI